jgi:cobalt-zinc-cadmium efflux system outer membrane protein
LIAVESVSTIGSSAAVGGADTSAVQAQQSNSPTLSDFALQDDVGTKDVTPVRTVSLKDSFDRAHQFNREVIAAQSNLPVAQAAIKIASAVPNPRFSLLYGWGPAFNIIIAGNPQQFGFMQQIQTAGKRTKAINAAMANYDAAELQVEATLFSVHNRVRRAYAEQAAAEAYEQLIESQRGVALELVRTAEKRFAAGKAARSELLQAQLGVLQFDTQRNQAQARLQQATAALATLLGEIPQHVEVIDVDDNGIFKLSAEHTDLVPQPKQPLPPLEQLLPVAYTQRPDLKQSIQQAYADRKSLTLARSQRIPDLFVDSGYQFTTFWKHQPYDLFTPPNPNTPVPVESGAYLNITVEAPIFYHHQGETDAAKDTWLQDYDQMTQLKYQVAHDIVASYEEVVVARANITQFQNKLLPQASQVAKIARRSYEVGKTDLASAILAKQQYQQILSSYFDAVVSYQNAWADLEQAMGVPLKL